MTVNVMKVSNSKRLLVPLLVVAFLAVIRILAQILEVASRSYYLPEYWPQNPHSRNSMVYSSFNLVEVVDNNASNLGEEDAHDQERSRREVVFGNDLSLTSNYSGTENTDDPFSILRDNTTQSNVQKLFASFNVSSKSLVIATPPSLDSVGAPGIRSKFPASMRKSQMNKSVQVIELEGIPKSGLFNIERYLKRMRRPSRLITLSEMKSMLHKSPKYSYSVRKKWSAVRDNELINASSQILQTQVLRNVSDLHAPLFRNVSVFKRSYELMEELLKIYVYKEGEKPIFHQPDPTGIYAAEGWFLELIERSKRYTVEDPTKAHLYYLPFSSTSLRWTLADKTSRNFKNLENHLRDYVELIKNKYSYWNATWGADHFFVACHDWALRITRKQMNSCIRALCNANVARGFSIGKDVSVPVTFIRDRDHPSSDIGGKPPSERDTLAFFAGKMHGYLRPLLLKYWENKVSDMKIFGPMSENLGEETYKEHMKNSKYCICAKGYDVHTPRVVESIMYECIPVIIADNYVPPFFEVLDWEAFAVFVQEKDIPNLRRILLTISEDRYLDMHYRLKMVRRHFLWHKIPKKYDLFHMILHSIWSIRISHVRAF